ncbi:DUF5691 domain-containing protein [Allostreptomyces psammosilenae]|uniref:Uncharacterized protein n=1 Tax=Allostreptomyces psammosilenae TaxID=1892865 RepID=A0A853ABB2_9ACTN|nr:DUF5691 domain-containing protein [Allostreptomyces psammosilenae]NYI07901.1 hypothetical protein [Allostreptomyces psammosilenae]
MTATPPPAPTWDDLVTTALLGTERRGLPTPPYAEADAAPDGTARSTLDAAASHAALTHAAGGPVDDPASALLAVAALHTVHRRARHAPLPAPEPDVAAPPALAADERPLVPEAARNRLTTLIAAAPAGSAESRNGNLLAEWLEEAARHGYRVPPETVPALLDRARARTALRPAVLALAGPLASWLAVQHRHWAYVLREPDAVPLGDGTGPDAPFGERLRMLRALRAEDPAAARDLLATTWSGERAEDRTLFLESLADGLGPADEPLLEAALDDRSTSVRTTAARLLAALPGSALSQRMTERALACCTVRGEGPDRRLRVVPPKDVDDAMRRDGLADYAGTGHAPGRSPRNGPRAAWLTDILAATPLRVWTDLLGTDPAGVIATPVSAEWATEIRRGWARAAVREGDTAWARALLRGAPARKRRGAGTEESDSDRVAVPAGTSLEESTGALLALLPAEEADELAARDGSLRRALPRWGARVEEAVLDKLRQAAAGGGAPWTHTGLTGLCEQRLSPTAADRLDALVKECEPGSAWWETLNEMARTLHQRRLLAEELAPVE